MSDRQERHADPADNQRDLTQQMEEAAIRAATGTIQNHGYLIAFRFPGKKVQTKTVTGRPSERAAEIEKLFEEDERVDYAAGYLDPHHNKPKITGSNNEELKNYVCDALSRMQTSTN